MVRRRRVELAARQVQQPVARREHLRRGGQVGRAVQPGRRVDPAVEAADRGERVHEVGDARLVGHERHRLAVVAAPLRALEEPPRLGADGLLVGEHVMVGIEPPERAAVAVQQAAVLLVGEARRDQRARRLHRVARVEHDRGRVRVEGDDLGAPAALPGGLVGHGRPHVATRSRAQPSGELG